MGLDMYAFSAPADAYDKEVDFIINDEFCTEVAYWRKHYALHGWMENLYKEKGSTEEFNCTNLNLTIDDIKQLENDLAKWPLPEQDLKFINDAKYVLLSGNKLYYTSWW